MKDLAIVARPTIPKEIYAFCRLVGNQRKNDAEMLAEVESIKILTDGINPKVLTTMCTLAVKRYPTDKAKNPYTVFDITYILTFKAEAEYLKRNGFNSWEEWGREYGINDCIEV